MRGWKAWGVAATSALTIGALVLISPGARTRAEDNAQPAGGAGTHREGLRSRLGLGAAERLVLKDVIRDVDGSLHRRFDRTYHGLPVIGGDVIVHRSPTGRHTTDWATTARLGELATIRPVVPAVLASRVAARSTGLPATPSVPQLVVYAVGSHARLAWRATAAATGVREVVVVDAVSGRRLDGWSDIHTADGTGRSLYYRTVPVRTVQVARSRYLLRDRLRGNHRVLDARHSHADPPTGLLMHDRDNVWGDFRSSSRQSAAVSVAYGHQVTWDFYQETFGRHGIRGDGTSPRSFVHYGTRYDNAFFDDECYCMVFGDGGVDFRPLVSLDVVGHEMTHGLTADTAGLRYVGESGGLNEATSDIFGALAEFFARHRRDPGDYVIGERFAKDSPGFLRRMDRPSSDAPLYGGQDHSRDCWGPTLGAADVHLTSGPANHFFYLLAEGSGAKLIGGRRHRSPTCDGSTVTGVGRGPAGQVWYRALRVYMTSTTNYVTARDATIRAARDLFGTAGPPCRRVARAWDAVSVPAGSWRCTAAPAPPGPDAVRNPGFEAGPDGVWTDPDNTITSATFAFPHRGSWYAFLNGFGTATSNTLSQPIRVPDSATARLGFWLLVHTSESPGSGPMDTLQVSVDDGSGRDVLSTYSNEDANNSYTRHELDLSSYAGKKVTLTFAGQEDDSGQTSFLLDDVSVTPR
jgi:Zn-dependent metalloprotease